MAKFKKALALVLSLAMVLTLAPIASVNSKAAAKYKISAKTTAISAGKTYNVKVTGVKKGQYVKVARTAGVTVKYNKKTIKASKKVAGTGKALTFKVTVPDKVANYKSTIKVVVYNKNGKKAKTLSTKRTVKVSEFSIASVVSTTDAAAAGYKYIRATFTKAIDALDASEVEISEKATGQIYSVEKVQLATNGKSADITLVGDVAAAGTTFLQANTDYVLNIKKSGATAHLDFNIPAVWANVIVYGVDAGKKQVSLNNAIFTLNDTIAAATDYNEILGRTVTVQYDKNRVINKLTVINETVEYGAFSLVDADNNGTKESIKNVVTKTVYPLSAQTVGDIKATTELNMDAGGALTAGTDVDYAKVTLNGNGTVRRISSITNFNEIQYVVSTKDDDIVNLKGTSFSLKDFNIFKGGKTITIKDIKEGDVVFMNTSKKLAEVYTEGSVSGKMTVYTDKIEVNGTRYDTKGDLVADKNVQAATNASLAKYAGSEVTVFFERNGDVAEIVVGTATKTADSYAVITKAAKIATSGDKYVVNFTADDGTGAKDYTLDATKLASVVQIGGGAKVTAGTAPAVGGFTVTTTGVKLPAFGGDIEGANAAGAPTGSLINISGTAGGGDMEAGQLIKLTKKEDGTIVGLELAGTARDWTLDDNGGVAAAGKVLFVDPTNAGTSFKAGAKEITDGTSTCTLPGTTPVLLWDATAKSVKAIKYSEVDFSFTIDDAVPATAARIDGVVRVDTTASVMAVGAIKIDVEAAGLQVAKTVTKRAVIVGATFDQSPAKKLVDLTVAYGNKADVKYTTMANDILESSLKAGAVYTDWAPGVVVDLKETEDGKLVEVKSKNADDANVDLTKTNKSDYIIDTNEKLITANDTSIVTTIVTMNTAGTAVTGAISWSDYCTMVRDNKIASAQAWVYSGVYYDVIVAKQAASTSGSSTTVAAKVTTNDELAAAIAAFGSADTIEIAASGLSTGLQIYSDILIDANCSLTLTSNNATRKITNNGVLNVRTANTDIGDVVNSGTVNVDAGATTFASLTNSGTVSATAALTVSGATSNSGTITNKSTLTLTGAVAVDKAGTWNLEGAAGNNNATVQKLLTTAFTATNAVNVNTDAATTAAATITDKVTVTVKSGATFTLGNTLNLNGKLVNNGIFDADNKAITMGEASEFSSVASAGAIVDMDGVALAATATTTGAKFVDKTNNSYMVVKYNAAAVAADNKLAADFDNSSTSKVEGTGRIAITIAASKLQMAISGNAD